jgi:hypothetical protein
MSASLIGRFAGFDVAHGTMKYRPGTVEMKSIYSINVNPIRAREFVEPQRMRCRFVMSYASYALSADRLCEQWLLYELSRLAGRSPEGRPCLHCMMVELLDEFFAEYPSTTSKPNTIDTDETITAIAKTVAELTCSQNGTIRQQLIEQLMREIMTHDAEFRREDATPAMGSGARH